MKTKIISLLVAALLVISLTPVLGVDTGTGIGIDIETEEFPVHIWQCASESHRVLIDDCVEEGRRSDCAYPPHSDDGDISPRLYERTQNYAFEGEQIYSKVLVMDKNKIEEVQDVVMTIGDTQGTGNDIEVECSREIKPQFVMDSCNARILEEELTEFDSEIMAYYTCVLTVETPESMQGEYFVTVEAISADSEAIMDENEFWFFNPIIALAVDGDVEFSEVRPGTVAYSSTILVGNDAEEGSGVLLDMFISGTDFYDPDSSGARCPDTNQLQLSNVLRSPANINDAGGADIDLSGAHHRRACEAGTVGLTGSTNADHLCYYATNGAYSTAGAPNSDAEGYVPIVYGDTFTRDFYNDAEIINENWAGTGFGSMNLGSDFPFPGIHPGIKYHNGNVLTPGAEIALNFKLGLPEPCVGNFNEGDIFFWGEAV